MAIIYVNESASGSNNGTTWTDAYTSLVTALSSATDGDELWVAQGTYSPGGAAGDFFDVAVSNLSIYGGFRGDEVNKNQRDRTRFESILDGDGVNEAILKNTNTTYPSTLIIDSLYFENCAGDFFLSALVFNYSGTDGDDNLEVYNSVFRNNSGFDGGAVTIIGNAFYSYWKIENCEFYNNTASRNGGAIYVGGTYVGGTNIRNCMFHNNSAVRGGAVYISTRLNVLESCAFYNNTVTENGGAVYNTLTTATFRNNSFYGNTAGINGGALFIVNSNTDPYNCVFYGNTATSSGNDIYVDPFVLGSEINYCSATSLSAPDVVNITIGSSNVAGDPNFVDPSNGDLRLKYTSQCIDAGDGDNATTYDIEGNPRVQVKTSPAGTGSPNYTDMGAYEFSDAVKRYYVQLSNSYTSTGHTGSYNDPYSYEDFVSNISAATGRAIYLLKGTRSSSLSDITATSLYQVSLIAWDLNEYGPWRILQPSNAFDVDAYMQDGIVDAERIYSLNGSKRMYMQGSAASTTDYIAGTHEQTNFVNTGTSNPFTVETGDTATVDRCIFNGNEVFVDTGATFTVSNSVSNIITGGAFLTGTGTISSSNMTYGWNPPVLPSNTSTDLTVFSLDGGTSPATISDTAGVGYDDGWANGESIFVNLSVSSTGNDGYYGENAVGLTEFIAALSDGLTFYLRGKASLPSSTNITITSGTASFKAWNLSKYGPWKLEINKNAVGGFSSGRVNMQGGSIRNNYSGGAGDLFLNNGEDLYIESVGNQSTIYGNLTRCTLNFDTRVLVQSDSSATFNNCILNKTGSAKLDCQNVGVDLIISNSISDASNFADLVDDNSSGGALVYGEDNTFNWTAPTLPDWDTSDYNEYRLAGSPSAIYYGVQSFLTTIYVDIASSNDTSLTEGGDSSSPASYIYLNDVISRMRGGDFRLKGVRDITNTAADEIYWLNEGIPYRNNLLSDWDNDTEGPWRLRADKVTLSGVNLFNGIIYSDKHVYLTGYTIEPYTDTTYFRDVFVRASDQIIIGSGGYEFYGDTLLSEANPIAFVETVPLSQNNTWSYINDGFVGGEYNTWWSTDFRTGTDAWELEEIPEGSDNWVAVQNSSVNVRLTPTGVALTGDFVYRFCIVDSKTGLGNRSEKFYIYDDTAGTARGGIEFSMGTNVLEFVDASLVTLDSVIVPTDLYDKIYIELRRKDGVITASYSPYVPDNYTDFSGSYTYADPHYIVMEGGDVIGAGCFALQVEGSTPGDTSSLPYGAKDLDAILKDSVIDTLTVSESSWSFNSISLSYIAQTDSTWSASGLVYSGTNQSGWVSATWPAWSSVLSNTKADFGLSVIGSGITLSGSGNYTNYNEGLWGEIRTNVGAYYFDTALNFTASPTLAYFSPTNPAPVTFTAIDDTGATSWRWDFGDGTDFYTTDPLFKNPTHSYTSEGVFTVSLTINESPVTTVTKAGYIIILRTLEATIVADPRFYYGAIPPGGLPVDFGVTNPTRTLDPTPAGVYPGFSWDYGDGSAVVTGLTGPSHDFTSYGTFNAQLTVRDIGVSGLDSTKQLTSFDIDVKIYNLTISVSPTLGKKPLVVNFTATPASGFSPVSYHWIFRDGAESSSQSPTHQYTTEGVYDTVLIIDQGFATQQIFSSDASYPGVDVVDPDMQVIVSSVDSVFTVSPIYGYIPLTGLFEDNSIGNITGWQWDFDDGSSQVLGETGLFHIYDTANTYNPTLTVYDIYGLTDTSSAEVIALSPLDIDVSDSTPTVTQSVTFSPVNDTYANQWVWDLIYVDPILGEITIDRKTTSTQADRNYVKDIVVPGDYKIQLTITDDLGNSYSKIESFTASENISIVTDPSPATGEVPLEVDFSTSGLDLTGINSIKWDLNGDGTTDSTSDTSSYTYNTPDTYSSTLVVEWHIEDVDNSALSTTVSIQRGIFVIAGQNPLVISISANPLHGHKPLVSTFAGSANNSVSTWKWEVRKASTSYTTIGSTQQITYTFSESGEYSVRLTVTDVYGETDSATVRITVVNDISTYDRAPDPDKLMEITGPGQLQIFNGGRGVRFRIPSGETSQKPYGFKRSNGPSHIYD